MKTFNYTNQYGTTYRDCYFRVGRYENNNLAVEIWNNTEGPIIKVTVNPDIIVPHDMIAIKNYSENEGMLAWLLLHGFIEDTPYHILVSGWVEIPVHRLTDKGKKYIGI